MATSIGQESVSDTDVDDVGQGHDAAQAKVEDLMKALASRTVIGTAVGILMERHGMSDDRAFAYLVRCSQTQNVKLRIVAAGLVKGANSRLPGSGALRRS